MIVMWLCIRLSFLRDVSPSSARSSRAVKRLLFNVRLRKTDASEKAPSAMVVIKLLSSKSLDTLPTPAKDLAPIDVIRF